jgi:hypothetical protein
MKIQEYLELSKDQLHDELARMGRDQRAKFDAKLAMLCALTTNTIEPRKLPAFTLQRKIIQPEKKTVKCRTYRAVA